VRITFDPAKRDRTLVERGLDFGWAAEVFDDFHLTFPDERVDYGEPRFVSVGRLRDRMLIVVWTPRGEARHVISMRKANGREQRRFQERLDRFG
jgi:hypothetical protein